MLLVAGSVPPATAPRGRERLSCGFGSCMLRRMSRRWSIFAVAAAVAILFQSPFARAAIQLPALVSDGMVLQQKTPVRIWGWGSDGEKVTVTLLGQSVTTEIRAGQWSVTLKPLDPGGPFEMTIAGDETRVIKDVLIGEVWVCSGQSNMEWPLERAFEARGDIAAPPDPQLRMFTVEKHVAAAPQVDVAGGGWESATPETRGHFSAVGYYFGRALRAARRVPVGLIHTSWGGTPAEAWTGRDALRAWGMPEAAFSALVPPSAAAKAAYERSLAAWTAAGRPQDEFEDPGMMDAARSWAWPRTDIRSWRAMALPQSWEGSGTEMLVDGGVWFRRDVTIPSKWAGRELEVHLGAIDDFDTTFFNGVRVGSIGSETPSFWQAPRRYRIPASAVQAGRGVVAVRVWDRGGEGGFMGPASEMWIAPAGAAAEERVSLAGDWQLKPERTRPSRPNPPGLQQNLPSVLYNAMILPLVPYAIKGATWYQGEANAGRAAQYRSLMKTMIGSWRADWHLGDFPFLIVQLAPYMSIAAEPEESAWAALREAQAQVARDIPRVGVAIITDVGDEKDIHPTRKKPVGERLALAARKLAYGENIVAFGPTFRSATIEGGKIAVSFDNVGKGLEMRGDHLSGFAIAGADEKFVNADASIVGDRVLVSSPRVAAPAYVRFGWANYPVVNLWNRDGLPATPFRTDPP
jgi:sialate O-acetylesterase